ncbi:hypothetical protein P8C59_008074 [Phyllachora maydis]|uniref:U6 snRNA phosphodiesterase n=1 Tax=Phyllachora maydis TaxID=1825666 RepID=A0AAD9I9Z7_9PEZI|nr:hypothetical protein P8C59_008074 [Phyllachora maydis]
MALVDYDTDSSAEPQPPPSKKQKPTTTTTTATNPPQQQHQQQQPLTLPASFHDLYASTVKTFDDPALHQGRRRQTAHQPGRWPSHLYIEWRPAGRARAALAALLARLPPPPPAASLLASDLGVPQPLHVSLSRAVSLPAARKDAFLADVRAAVARRRGPAAFALRVRGLDWHFTEESDRAFLVLRVRGEEKEKEEEEQEGGNPNPELTELLRRLNRVARDYDLPELYNWAEKEDGRGGKMGGGERKEGDTVGHAFHISIAWSFGQPSEERQREARHAFGECLQGQEDLRDLSIRVDCIKAKIGNVITTIPLGMEATGVAP